MSHLMIQHIHLDAKNYTKSNLHHMSDTIHVINTEYKSQPAYKMNFLSKRKQLTDGAHFNLLLPIRLSVNKSPRFIAFFPQINQDQQKMI